MEDLENKYCKAFNSKIFVFDPYKNIKEKYIKQLIHLIFANKF